MDAKILAGAANSTFHAAWRGRQGRLGRRRAKSARKMPR